MLTIPNAAEALMLDAITGKVPATALTLRLYTALSPALANSTVVGHLTEAAGGGYAAIALTAASWTTTPGAPSSSAYPKQTFTFTGALTGNPAVLGYYVTNAAGALEWLEALPGSFTPAATGDAVDVTPVFTLASIATD